MFTHKNPKNIMQANTHQVISGKPSFGGTNSAFTPIVKKHNEQTPPTPNAHLIKIRNERTNAFIGIRTLFRKNKTNNIST